MAVQKRTDVQQNNNEQRKMQHNTAKNKDSLAKSRGQNGRHALSPSHSRIVSIRSHNHNGHNSNTGEKLSSHQRVKGEDSDYQSGKHMASGANGQLARNGADDRQSDAASKRKPQNTCVIDLCDSDSHSGIERPSSLHQASDTATARKKCKIEHQMTENVFDLTTHDFRKRTRLKRVDSGQKIDLTMADDSDDDNNADEFNVAKAPADLRPSWTINEDQDLIQGIKDTGNIKNQKERWGFIARGVGNKTIKHCKDRFEQLRQELRTGKTQTGNTVIASKERDINTVPRIIEIRKIFDTVPEKPSVEQSTINTNNVSVTSPLRIVSASGDEMDSESNSGEQIALNIPAQELVQEEEGKSTAEKNTASVQIDLPRIDCNENGTSTFNIPPNKRNSSAQKISIQEEKEVVQKDDKRKEIERAEKDRAEKNAWLEEERMALKKATKATIMKDIEKIPSTEKVGKENIEKDYQQIEEDSKVEVVGPIAQQVEGGNKNPCPKQVIEITESKDEENSINKAGNKENNSDKNVRSEGGDLAQQKGANDVLQKRLKAIREKDSTLVAPQESHICDDLLFLDDSLSEFDEQPFYGSESGDDSSIDIFTAPISPLQSFTSDPCSPGQGSKGEYSLTKDSNSAEEARRRLELRRSRAILTDKELADLNETTFSDMQSKKESFTRKRQRRKFANSTRGPMPMQPVAPLTDSSPDIDSHLQGQKRRLKDLEVITVVKEKTFMENQKLIKHMTVMSDQETLYDFRLERDASSIPNSGYGVFLIFEGARELKKELREKSDEVLKSRFILLPKTVDSLVASIEPGVNFKVNLTGENLNGNGNNPYFSLTRFPLRALVHGKDVTVNLGPRLIHEDIDLLQSRKEIPQNGLGHLQMHSEKDYVANNEIQFCSYESGCGLVDIGRYGPFLSRDRKTEREFLFKNFVFDNQPAEFVFGVHEKLRKRDQLIDITSDCTGEPHTVAQNNIQMYVNEVGHNKDLKQNVIARVKDDRVVHYYLHLDKPISKGDKLELLTCYDVHYEEVRERKGYGARNMNEGLKSDEDIGTQIGRDSVDRTDVEDEIKELSLSDFELILQFICNKIYEPIAELIASNKVPLSKRQWIARRRLKWLLGLFQSQLETLLKDNSKNKQDSVLSNIHILMNQMEKKLEVSTDRVVLKAKSGENVVDIFHDEMMKEYLCAVSKDEMIVKPLDSSIWCPITQRLTRDIGKAISTFHLIKSSPETPQYLKQLANDILELATKAALDVRGESNSKVAQDRDNSQRANMKEMQEKMLKELHKEALVLSCTQQNSAIENVNRIQEKMVPIRGDGNDDKKALEILDKYKEALNLSGMQESSVLENLPKEITPIVITGREGENWDKLFQVVQIVYIFTTQCIKQGLNKDMYESQFFSLERLCEAVKINSIHVKEKLGISIPLSEVVQLKKEIQKEKRQQTKKRKRQGRTKKVVKQVTNRKKANFPNYDESDGTLPEGWRLERVKRLTSNHVDRYWHTKTELKLRSRVEVQIFLEYLKKVNDENLAFKMLYEEKERMRLEREQKRSSKRM